MRLIASVSKSIAHPLHRKSIVMKNWLSRENLGIKWILSIGLWIFLGVLFAFKTYIYSHIIGMPIYLWRSLSYTMPNAIVWGIMTPIVLWFTSLYKIESNNWYKNLLIQIIVCLFLAPFLVIIAFEIDLLFKWIGGVLPENPSFVMAAFNPRIFANSFDNILTYSIIVGIYYVYDYYQRFRERELKAARLEAQLATARLDLLKAQLNPHFLFNTLNAISIVKDHDLEAADLMITDLSEMLRFVMENIHKQEISLREEMEFLDCYISLQKRRFVDQMEVNVDVDPKAWNALVPSLLLQPIVENAIEHGVRNQKDKGKIDIRCLRNNGSLEFEVRNNGPELGKSNPSRGNRGIGLSNTKERLKSLYGSDFTFKLENSSEGGVVAKLTIPYRWDDQ